MSEDESFIGVLNLIRLHSYYFDSETSWYYNGKYYFDSINNKYIVNSVVNNVVNNVVQEGISVRGDYDYDNMTSTQKAIQDWHDRLMANSSFGVAITYTTNWYSSLSEVELIARLIYGENTVNTFDQDAVARVLTNRKNANKTMFGGDTYRGVATKAAQFEPITGGSSGTVNARVPDTSKTTWSNAVLVACCLLSSPSTTDYNYFITKPTGISTQLYFLGLTYFINNAIDDDITYNFGGSTYYDLKDVVIVFTNTSTLQNPATITAIKSNASLDTLAERNTHNIFFNY